MDITIDGFHSWMWKGRKCYTKIEKKWSDFFFFAFRIIVFTAIPIFWLHVATLPIVHFILLDLSVSIYFYFFREIRFHFHALRDFSKTQCVCKFWYFTLLLLITQKFREINFCSKAIISLHWWDLLEFSWESGGVALGSVGRFSAKFLQASSM